ncbi:hypothetical protein V9K67_17745 [Paraflavisolibacter sp. H34]|uniref:hypothetical protein n=1 Tax=Huijunlia imazamoxiresistens TaxID=3127457 RepID=UPI0030198DDB
MNNLIKGLKALLLPLFLLATSCKKSEYLTDEGVHSAATPLSTYDYLKGHSWQSFDSLVAIIDHYGLKDEVNGAKTFFAPTDYSINRFFALKKAARDENNPYTMDTLYKEISADSIRQYLFGEKLTLAGASEVPAALPTLGHTQASVVKIRQTDAAYYQWAGTPVYQLYYTRVRGALDDPNAPVDPNNPDRDTRVLCQTTGIETASGTTLHVLVNTHVFVRF